MSPHFATTPATPPHDPESQSHTKLAPHTWYHKLWLILKTHASFVGPGILASVAYFDPGNWATDLAAGSQYGYSLLFVVLCAGLGAILFQVLSCRLGIVTGKDLAQHLRALLHSREKHRMLWRWGLLYPLYVLSELAIVATDLAELLGSAIALNLLFPRLPLYAGVLITASDVLVILIAYRPNGGARSMRIFEIIISILVLAVFISFIILTFRIKPDWGKAFHGYLPSKVLVSPGALYASIGIVGATVMPHALYLGSRLSTLPRLLVEPPAPSPSAALSMMASARTSMTAVDRNFDKSALDNLGIHLKRLIFEAEDDEIKSGGIEGNKNLTDGDSKIAFIRTHVRHASWDIILSLFCFAVTINSAILIVASAAFYYGIAGGMTVGDLFDAYQLIKDYMGGVSAFLFAFALLCAGQSASITVTLAGQVISEGFLQWSISPFVRRIFTRLIGIVPSVIISVALGRSGIDTLLIASQVALSMILPFVVFPLVWITSARSGIMRVWIPSQEGKGSVSDIGGKVEADELPTCPPEAEGQTTAYLPTSPPITGRDSGESEIGLASAARQMPPPTPSLLMPVPNEQTQTSSPQCVGRYEDFSSPWYVTTIGYTIFTIMLAANVYAVVQLAHGE
ncbi:hypothetical protein FRB93_008174 [Tulasnella sp. JGI-2019a]|nr:hypothetical protein FRB93_008174 [Tulasnella sp. JGI-2019a]